MHATYFFTEFDVIEAQTAETLQLNLINVKPLSWC